VGHGGYRAKVIGGDKIDVCALFLHCSEEVSSNTAKSVDTDADGHELCNLAVVGRSGIG